MPKKRLGRSQLPDGKSALGFYDQRGIDTCSVDEMAAVAPTRPRPRAIPPTRYRWPAELEIAVREASGTASVSRCWCRTACLGQRRQASEWAPGNRRTTPTSSPRRPSLSLVRRWMIWGEPNAWTASSPTSGQRHRSASYARLLDTAYAAPNALLNKSSSRNDWTGGAITPAVFIRSMLLPNGPPAADWFGHNPFPFRFPTSSQHARSGRIPRHQRHRHVRPRDRQALRAAEGRPCAVAVGVPGAVRTGLTGLRTFVTRQQQARCLRPRIARRRPAQAGPGLGWLDLLDEPPSAERPLGLLTYDLRPQPSFFAMQSAPSERLSPLLRVSKRARRGNARGRGLLVTLVPRRGGRVRLELRRGAAILRRVIVRGRDERIEQVRFGAVRCGGAYTSPPLLRGATVDRVVAVR